MKKHLLVVGIISLFIFSAFAPMSIGYNVKTSNDKEPQSTTSSDSGLMNSSWPMFQHDIRHTGRSPFGINGTWYVEKWYVEIGDMSDSSPVIDKNGTIYIGGDIDLYAINSDGTIKWRCYIGDVAASPAIAEDGTIICPSYGKLNAVNPDGTLKWRVNMDGTMWSPPVIDDDGIIYVGDTSGYRIKALYPNGTLKWSYKTGEYVLCGPVLDDTTVYCASHDTYVYAIYKNNGTLKWKFNSPDWIWGISIADDGTIYFTNCNGYLYAIYTNGTQKWRRDLGNSVSSGPPAIAEDGSIYVAVEHNSWIFRSDIFCINPDDGAIKWQYNYYTEDITSPPAIDKFGVIHFGTGDGWLLALNPDGTLRWSFKALDFISTPPAIGEDGTIYFSSTFTSQPDFYAYIYALEPIEGNSPPEIPSIDGPQNINYHIKCTFSVTAIDPDGDNISYFFDWGNGENSGWTKFIPSGTTLNQSNIFRPMNTPTHFTIRVKAKDEHGAWSDWKRYNTKIDKNKEITNVLFLRLLQHFPLFNLLLQRLRI